MKIPLLLSLAAASSISIPTSWGLEPTAGHQEMTRHIESGIDWAKHLSTEVGKGKKMDAQHVKDEVQGIREAIKSIEETHAKIAQTAPGDAAEGHFMALKRHQEKAAELIGRFEIERQKPDVNLSTMKKMAKQTLRELESAKREHDLELYEIEHRH